MAHMSDITASEFLFGVVIGLTFDIGFLFRGDCLQKLLLVQSIPVLVVVLQVVKGTFQEAGVDVDASEVLHVVIVEVFLQLDLREQSVVVDVEFDEG